jgi:plasmid stabilization system protein ParE
LVQYDIILETTAALDLYGILDYITDVLKQPETAERIFLSIEEQIMTLDYMPTRHNIVRDEPYASLGVRMMPVESYFAFYVVDEIKYEVHILRILYKRREWQNIL